MLAAFNKWWEENDFSNDPEEIWEAATERALRAVEKVQKERGLYGVFAQESNEIRRLIEKDENL
jgi:hypothetical protein